MNGVSLPLPSEPPSAPTATRLVGQPAFLSAESYALLLLVTSSITYSVMSAFVKLAAATGLSSSELVFLRGLFQGVLVVAAMVVYRDNQHGNTRIIFLPFGTRDVRNVVIARGIVGGIGFMLYYYATSVLPLGDATTLLSLTPVITVFAAAIFLGEPVRTFDVVAAVGSVAGCILIAQPSFLFGERPIEGDSVGPSSTAHHHPTSGYICALLGSCCGSTVFILIRRAGKGGVHTLQLLFSWVTFGLLFSFLFGVVRPFLSYGDIAFVWPRSSLAWSYVLGISIFGSTGHLLLNYAGRHAPAGLGSIVRSSGILWSYVLEVIVFSEVPRGLTFVGVLLIVLSLGTIAYEKQLDSMRQAKNQEMENSSGADLETGPLCPPESKYNSLTPSDYGSASQ